MGLKSTLHGDAFLITTEADGALRGSTVLPVPAAGWSP